MESSWVSESTTSLNSVGSGRIQPRPPAAPRPSRTSKPRRASYISRSPYLATMAMPAPPRTHPRDRWPISAKKVLSRSTHKSQSLSNTVIQAYAQSRKRTHSQPKSIPLEDSATLDLRDEITELRQQLRTAQREREDERAEARRTREALTKKEKQVGELLAGGQLTSREMTRMVGGTDKTAMISSLKHSAHQLQTALRQKEDELRLLQRDIKSTRLKELELEKDTYYHEVIRLQSLAEKISTELNDETPNSRKELKTKVDILNDSLVKMSERLEEMEGENRRLKKRQGKRSSLLHGETGTRGVVADQYLDLSQAELIAVIVDKEMQLNESCDSAQSLTMELEQARADHETEMTLLRDDLASRENELEEMKKREIERDKAIEKLECVVRKLKEDRTHYRTLAEENESFLSEAQKALQEREKEIEKMKNAVHQQTTEGEEREAAITSRESQRCFRAEGDSELRATLTLQREWRKMAARRRQKRFEEHLELTSRQLQAVLRGHLVRKVLTEGDSSDLVPAVAVQDSEREEELMDDEIVSEELQSILRGHMTRRRRSHIPLQELLAR